MTSRPVCGLLFYVAVCYFNCITEAVRMNQRGLENTDIKNTIENDEGWLACDGTESEACHCEQQEINCDNVIFKDESSLSTANLDIYNKSFRVIRATFRDNTIVSLRQKKVLPGHESTVREIDFSNNRIVHIESRTFSSFRSLNKLYLSNNKIKLLKSNRGLGITSMDWTNYTNFIWITINLPAWMMLHFIILSNLRKLILDGNKIKLRKEVFDGLDSLEELSLDYCGMEDLDIRAFELLPRLKKLSLRGNPFSEVPRALNALNKLEDLDISNTNIAEFHAQSLKLEEVVIGGNPINCTCETAFLLEDEYFSYEYTNTLPKCASPPALKGRLLTRVTQIDACAKKASIQMGGRFAGVSSLGENTESSLCYFIRHEKNFLNECSALSNPGRRTTSPRKGIIKRRISFIF
ncbi:leucine Rich repeat-containing domain protein [Dictyocaulus viviparus]|uniref:Leucine Rich repeat-containing domain protein n=1 Tax=Dictyocaulus viviparus TaxID=29172 RepID=A0A0D8XE86_DICVI|nr:leucine Rich repeat-containing domain protein [Dictyocaulus viviparus]